MRSETGLGRLVRLYYLAEDPSGRSETPLWTHGIGEDYAAGETPLVVKVRPELEREEVVRLLRELAKNLDEGGTFWTSIDPDRSRLSEPTRPGGPDIPWNMDPNP